MLLLFSHPIMSDSSQPHEPQHARPTCPSPLLEFAQVHVHCIGDANQPSHLLMSLLLNDWANLQNCLIWIKNYKQNKLCDSFYPTAAHLIRLYTYFSRKYWKLIQYIMSTCQNSFQFINMIYFYKSITKSLARRCLGACTMSKHETNMPLIWNHIYKNQRILHIIMSII